MAGHSSFPLDKQQRKLENYSAFHAIVLIIQSDVYFACNMNMFAFWISTDEGFFFSLFLTEDLGLIQNTVCEAKYFVGLSTWMLS